MHSLLAVREHAQRCDCRVAARRLQASCAQEALPRYALAARLTHPVQVALQRLRSAPVVVLRGEPVPAPVPYDRMASALQAEERDALASELVRWAQVQRVQRCAHRSRLVASGVLRRALREPRPRQRRPSAAPAVQRRQVDWLPAWLGRGHRARWRSMPRYCVRGRRVRAPPSVGWRGSADRFSSTRRGCCPRPASRRSSRHAATHHRLDADRCVRRRRVRDRDAHGPRSLHQE